jgi:hypothetical protein
LKPVILTQADWVIHYQIIWNSLIKNEELTHEDTQPKLWQMKADSWKSVLDEEIRWETEW